MLSTAQLGSGLSPTSSAAQGSSQMHPDILQGKLQKLCGLCLQTGRKKHAKSPYFSTQGRETVDQILMENFLPDIISYFLELFLSPCEAKKFVYGRVLKLNSSDFVLTRLIA